ncbi:MAG: molybdenum cofactor biosynthesis protein B [Prochlorotrichaceae cyanobacterium]|jgi:molybdenum cofactor biosynthesis protein B
MPISLPIAILTISDTRTLDTDRSGQYLVDAVTQAGHTVSDRQLVQDNRYAIRAIVSQWIADPVIQVILTTGGTGITPRDTTPEALRPLFDQELPGFGELFRWLSYAEIGNATLQSRAVGGLANGTLLFCLPGSTGACRTAWEKILQSQLHSETTPCNFVTLLSPNQHHPL